ncbi:hypothetical protein H3Z83_08095 [Tenacibaculum sp. S7007]|uniref:Lipoprotein n=1 Tax=Tenacibaculum pelagium TaxID=2759527 RepID=A0A839AQ10_9FLAO|nr:hypothetical protein [Tenacibaculum pelagium]MBA6156470.1 hypothetical protein [Tenacibaculum pelagium]
MKKNLCLIVLSILLSCKSEKQEKPIEVKSWIYLEMGSKEDSNNDAVYGEISQKHLSFLRDNTKSEKLIMISNARFIDKDSIIKDVTEGTNEKGILFYKIKTINYVEVLKEDPINKKNDYIK